MAVTMTISGQELSEDAVDALTRQLAETLRRETDIAAQPAAADATPGSKGDPVTLGTLVLTFISSGAAVALFEVIKTYFSREPRLVIDIEKADGSSVSLSATNLEPGKVDETLLRLKDVLSD